MADIRARSHPRGIDHTETLHLVGGHNGRRGRLCRAVPGRAPAVVLVALVGRNLHVRDLVDFFFFKQKTAYEILYVNPTTSTRFNAYMPGLIRDLKLRVTG